MARAQTEETLDGWAEAAADLYARKGMSPTDAVVEALRPHARNITDEHARRVCEKTHHSLYRRLFGAPSGPHKDRTVTFRGGPPDAVAVASALKLERVEAGKDPSAGPQGASMSKEAPKTASAPPAPVYVPAVTRRPSAPPERDIIAEALAMDQAQKLASAAPETREPTLEDWQEARSEYTRAAHKLAAYLEGLGSSVSGGVERVVQAALPYVREDGVPAWDILRAAEAGIRKTAAARGCSGEDIPPVLQQYLYTVSTALAGAGLDITRPKTASRAYMPDHFRIDENHALVRMFAAEANLAYEYEVASEALADLQQRAKLAQASVARKVADLGADAMRATGRALLSAGAETAHAVGKGVGWAAPRFGARPLAGEAAQPIRNSLAFGGAAALGAQEMPGVAQAGHATYQALANPLNSTLG